MTSVAWKCKHCDRGDGVGGAQRKDRLTPRLPECGQADSRKRSTECFHWAMICGKHLGKEKCEKHKK